MNRFWDKVNKTNCCWIWTACCVQNGYGQFRIGGKRKYAHRISWELMRGPIPDGMQVLHECDNPPCVNPSHLFLGTHDDNMRDKTEKGRQSRGSRSNRSDLNEADILQILRLHKAGLSAIVIARSFPANRRTIGEIINGKSWKHVDRSLVN